MKQDQTCRCGGRLDPPEAGSGRPARCARCGREAGPTTDTAGKPPLGYRRCEFCHNEIPILLFDAHVRQHLAIGEDGQQQDYASLPADECDPEADLVGAPRHFRHTVCGAVTVMPDELIHTYLTDPWFYMSDKTYCSGCSRHVRQNQLFWVETGENMLDYTKRLRADKPEMRPSLATRILAWVVNRFPRR